MIFGRIIQGRSYTHVSPGEPLCVSRQKLFPSMCLVKHSKWIKNSSMLVCFIKSWNWVDWVETVMILCLTDLFVLDMFFHSANLLHFLSLSPTMLEPGGGQASARRVKHIHAKTAQWNMVSGQRDGFCEGPAPGGLSVMECVAPTTEQVWCTDSHDLSLSVRQEGEAQLRKL